MMGSDEQIVKEVEIEVPKAVEERARQHADGEDLDEYLLDAFVFEYDWVFEDE